MVREMEGGPGKEKDIIGSSAQGFGTDLVAGLPDLECCQPSWTNWTWEMLPAFLDEPDLGMLPAFLDEPDLGILLDSGLEMLPAFLDEPDLEILLDSGLEMLQFPLFLLILT
ncbi:hypothetical protein RCL_jg15046.t1 [Rhizophagus clarus]|uniref:Uncharacterized protein n=1 Tax=Rhizophagus clarus TaxID=94130 RepID=A0A8H3LSM6_9GLOM|nr:hypothetical protein RCL_jg14177.t1 [Rhizophagus clarus]GES99553.1 hypothetical protein RCL_jg15046.t1 [Rhizophagus clarus]